MGLTFAKSVRFGPVRFNFSGSGIGVSAGIPGLRFGVGPRGALVSGGKGGFRYRKSLGPVSGGRRAPSSPSASCPADEVQVAPDPLVVGSVEHDTKHVLELSDASGDELLRSMNEQRGKTDLWPVVAGGLALVYFVVYQKGAAWPALVHLLLIAAFIAMVVFTYWRDGMRKLTVLFFDPDEHAQQRFEPLNDAVQRASQIARLQSIATTSRYGDTRYTSGASQGLKFGPARLFLGQAPGVAANISVPILQAGKTTLAFYPDRVLAFQGKSVGAIDYGNLQAVSKPSRFVEQGRVPSDAKVVDHTWQYVNKNGTPDKRFKNNRQYPVCSYNQLDISTPSGLDLRFMGSKEGGFDPLEAAVKAARLDRLPAAA
jgi:hypothetical protein